MLKIHQVGLQQYVNCELPDIQAGFRKGRGTRNQIANIFWIIKKARVSGNHLLLLYRLRQSLLTVWITINCGKFLNRWGYHTTHLTYLLRNLYIGQEATVRTRSGTTDWSQIGKEYVKAIYCHPAYLT